MEEQIGGGIGVPWERTRGGSLPEFSRAFSTPEGVNIVEKKEIGPVFQTFRREESEKGLFRSISHTSRKDGAETSSSDVEAKIPYLDRGDVFAEITLMDFGEGNTILLPRIKLDGTELGRTVPYVDLGYLKDGDIDDIDIKICHPQKNISPRRGILEDLQDDVPPKTYRDYLQELAGIYRMDETYDSGLTFDEEDTKQINEVLQNPNFSSLRNVFVEEILDAFQGIPPSLTGKVINELINESAVSYLFIAPNPDISEKDDAKERFEIAIKGTIRALCQRYEDIKNAPTEFNLSLIKGEGDSWKMAVIDPKANTDDAEKAIEPEFEQKIELGNPFTFENNTVNLRREDGRYVLEIERKDVSGNKTDGVVIDLSDRIDAQAIVNGMKSKNFDEFRKSLSSFDVRVNNSRLLTAA